MVQPRMRRSRRTVNLSSDDDEYGSSPSGIHDDGEYEEKDETLSTSKAKPKALSSRSRKSQPALPSSQSTSASARSTPQSTPKKPKQPTLHSKSPDQSKTRTLYSFFNVATQQQLQASAKTGTGSSTPLEKEEEDDAIQDVISDGDEDIANRENRPNGNADNVRNKKRLRDGLDPHGVLSGGQKYLKLSDGSKGVSSPAPIDTDIRPWNEKYGPAELTELVVHKRKVADVRYWLERALAGHRHSKLLVLKGAAGSGKTATLAMLSRTLNFDLVEWHNSASSEYLAAGYVSVAAQVEDFLGRGSRFGGLDLVSASGLENGSSQGEVTKQPANDKQVLVMEEFPNNLTRATAALHTFRSTLLQFLEADGQRATPLVMVISESVISDSNSSVDNFTAHRLLGPEILHHPSVAVIEFNRVAPTFIARALNMTLQKHWRDTRTSYQPSDGALKKLSEFGDVRNAISTLEFLCTQKGDTQDAIRPIKPRPKSRSTKAKTSALNPANDSIRDEELSIISLRETSIGLFHAVARVLYNKRSPVDETPASSTTLPSFPIPDHLLHLSRPLPPEVDLDSLIDETGTDSSTFLSSLHENYLLSCFAPDGDPTATMEHIIGCLDALADADLLNSNSSNNASTVSGSSGLRQSELSFQAGVRGLLFNLPYPIKRQAPPGKSKADAHRMFYPTSLRLWRGREETQELVELFVQRALSGTLLPRGLVRTKSLASGKSLTQSGGSPFKFAKSSFPAKEQDSSPVNGAKTTSDPTETDPPRIIVGSGHSARHEMLLERLPYMKAIYSRKDGMAGSSLLKQIDQITQFSGIGGLQDDEEGSEEPDISDVKPSSVLAKNNKAGQSIFSSSGAGKGGMPADLAAVEKLVLSDDDIEDD